jgi:hypothetical protein
MPELVSGMPSHWCDANRILTAGYADGTDNGTAPLEDIASISPHRPDERNVNILYKRH